MTGLFGSLLQVRVIGTLKDRELNTLLRGRGSKTFYKWLEELSDSISSSGRKIREIGISHAQGLEFSQKAKEVLQKFVEKPIFNFRYQHDNCHSYRSWSLGNYD